MAGGEGVGVPGALALAQPEAAGEGEAVARALPEAGGEAAALAEAAGEGEAAARVSRRNAGWWPDCSWAMVTPRLCL